VRGRASSYRLLPSAVEGSRRVNPRPHEVLGGQHDAQVDVGGIGGPAHVCRTGAQHDPGGGCIEQLARHEAGEEAARGLMLLLLFEDGARVALGQRSQELGGSRGTQRDDGPVHCAAIVIVIVVIVITTTTTITSGIVIVVELLSSASTPEDTLAAVTQPETRQSPPRSRVSHSNNGIVDNVGHFESLRENLRESWGICLLLLLLQATRARSTTNKVI